jgi:hypothetical protein
MSYGAFDLMAVSLFNKRSILGQVVDFGVGWSFTELCLASFSQTPSFLL